jgi:hypothetical protein
VTVDVSGSPELRLSVTLVTGDKVSVTVPTALLKSETEGVTFGTDGMLVTPGTIPPTIGADGAPTCGAAGTAGTGAWPEGSFVAAGTAGKLGREELSNGAASNVALVVIGPTLAPSVTAPGGVDDPA